VEAFIPNEHAEAEVGYTVHASTGESTVEVHQKSYNDLWVKLGDFSFDGGGAAVTTNDATGVKKEEIAWDALRFTPISTPPKTEERPSTSGASGGSPNGTPAQIIPNLALVEPMVPEQNGLVDFAKLGLRLGRRGPKLASHGYSIRRLYPVPKSLKLSYRCLPCVVVSLPLRLRSGSRTPRTHTIRTHGDLRRLVGKRLLYKGTQLQVEASEHGYRPRRYLYRLPGNGPVAAPIECTAATPASVKGCAT